MKVYSTPSDVFAEVSMKRSSLFSFAKRSPCSRETSLSPSRSFWFPTSTMTASGSDYARTSFSQFARFVKLAMLATE